jgi:hypothetical protein
VRRFSPELNSCSITLSSIRLLRVGRYDMNSSKKARLIVISCDHGCRCSIGPPTVVVHNCSRSRATAGINLAGYEQFDTEMCRDKAQPYK